MESRKLQRPKPAACLLAFCLFFVILFLILGFPRLAQVSSGHPNIGGNAITTISKKTKKVLVQEAYGKLPLSFSRNDGQIDRKVKFYEKGSGRATFFAKDGVYLFLTNGQNSFNPPSPQSE